MPCLQFHIIWTIIGLERGQFCVAGSAQHPGTAQLPGQIRYYIPTHPFQELETFKIIRSFNISSLSSLSPRLLSFISDPLIYRAFRESRLGSSLGLARSSGLTRINHLENLICLTANHHSEFGHRYFVLEPG